ncbi:MAG: hypothetical protein HY878_02495 [Deltaproteobacteria bacterium]|nr:hypothetical protein [Deltaproteobacteria bacterium]
MQATIEERVAYLEGKVEEHSRAWDDLKDMMVHLDQRITFLDQKVDRFRDELSSRINALEEKVDRRIDALDQRLSSRIDTLDAKLSRYFLWIIGIQVTVLLAVIGVLLKV